ncbi:MAG: DUF5103 domain-containing protein [Bacteroidetes bacterium]|nr:DUF5103 domain-containing protein [Bacteroidota bacterium]MBU1580476.1 DUF5103 domain-containing protein [Bacteroidota bacterium]MBU2466544.1 DUF5103 domain-containing protein [Bacteroidota bacterium]MBU2557730.1 DUF5103 domain-containing protein [Bacteroidota bacterium]
MKYLIIAKHGARFFAVFLLFIFNTLHAQSYDFLEFKNEIYDESIQTVLLHPIDEPLLEPLILLTDQTEKLLLSFDVLGDYANTYQYTFIHCTHDWKPSDLQRMEYLSGFDEERIDQYRFSLNTLTPYVHYDVLLPGSQMQLTKSGNYLLVVYEESLNAEQILFTRRLMLVDPQVSIKAHIPQYARKVSVSRQMQQVDVKINASNVFFTNAQQAVNLVIRQNNRWDNAVMALKPNYVYPDQLSFEYEDETLFDGGNQFRHFDMKSFRYQAENIERIFQEPNYYTVRLWPDKRRVLLDYSSEPDIYGQKLIKARNDQDTDIEGDYAWVEFFLEADAPFTHEEVFVIGALNDWNLDEKNMLTYNFKRKGYQGAIFLKQGYYDYIYGVAEKGQHKASVAPIEGNHWDTNNLYSIFCYYRKPGTSFDQLVGVAEIPSHP